MGLFSCGHVLDRLDPPLLKDPLRDGPGLSQDGSIFER
jgi:hypothetical protein